MKVESGRRGSRRRSSTPTGAGRLSLVQQGLIAHGLHNGTRLCEAIVQCLHMADTDAQEKAVLALQKLKDAGVLMGKDSSNACAIGEELDKLGQRCREAAGARANAGDEDDAGMTAESCSAVEALRQEFSQ